MNLGRIEQLAAPQEVYERPATPFVEDFLGRVLRFPGTLVAREPRGLVVRLDGAPAPLVAAPSAPPELAPGAPVVFPVDAYTGTRALLSELEQRGALSLRAVDVTDTDAVLAALDGARVLWLESPTNPMLGIAELPRLLEAAKAARVFSS